MEAKKYSLTKEDRLLYAALILLRDMIVFKFEYKIILEGNHKYLEDIFTFMLTKNYVEIKNDRVYIPTQKGREACSLFEQRYEEYLRVYDIFSLVDLSTGEFAFSKYYDMEEGEWEEYKKQDRWEDLRIPIAEFKKINPVEIVFLQFLNEMRFDLEKEGWEFELVNNLIWDEIIEICNKALTVEKLGFQDKEENRFVPGTEVLEVVLEEGFKVLKTVWEKEKELEKEREEYERQMAEQKGEEYVVAETVVEYETYTCYEDPYYVSPIWFVFYY